MHRPTETLQGGKRARTESVEMPLFRMWKEEKELKERLLRGQRRARVVKGNINIRWILKVCWSQRYKSTGHNVQKKNVSFQEFQAKALHINLIVLALVTWPGNPMHWLAYLSHVLWLHNFPEPHGSPKENRPLCQRHRCWRNNQWMSRKRPLKMVDHLSLGV